jgi:hypothetical protein
VTSVATITDLVRSELGDTSKSFVMRFVADGTTNRFTLHYAPLDSSSVYVSVNGVDVSNNCSVEESTGVLVTDSVPTDGQEITVAGNYFRYFTSAEIQRFVDAAFLQHSNNRVDSLGRIETLDNLPAVEVYPLAVLATTQALYTLATDASFDINVSAPDGVSIPRAERYRQLMDMLNVRKEQYRELCVLLGIGLYRIEVFTFRRISKTTNQYVPIYRPQEVDDYSYPERVELPKVTYGDQTPTHPYDSVELTAYQHMPFTYTLPYTGDLLTKGVVANVRWKEGVDQSHLPFTVVVGTSPTDSTSHTITISLTADQTRQLALRMYWDVQFVYDSDGHKEVYKAGKLFTVREVTT